MKKFNMIGGLPRAGSTLLCQILNSNPDFHVTPTSAILDMLKVMRSNFSQNPTWRAQDRMSIYTNFRQGLEGFLNGFFYDSKVVFDKNRAWTSNIKLIDSIFDDQSSKMIWLYRDPVEIISSIEAQHQKTFLMENMDEAAAPGAFATLDRRIGTYAAVDGLIASPIEGLKDAIEMGYSKRILFIKYYDLTHNTQIVMDAIHEFIDEPRYQYDLKNIKQSTWEYDGIYNYKFLHTIKEGEVKFKTGDFKLEEKFVKAINERFAAINQLILNDDASLLLNLPKIEEVKNESQITTEVTDKKNPFVSPVL